MACIVGGNADISIHVPREGDDGPASRARPLFLKFLSTSPARGTTRGRLARLLPSKISIHVPREGDDPSSVDNLIERLVFLSTSPARGTTDREKLLRHAATKFLSTSPARGTTLWQELSHSPLPFLSTSPARGTTSLPVNLSRFPSDFYPRPPRGGRPGVAVFGHIRLHFYPRPPRGGRLSSGCAIVPKCQFLSTSPARGTTPRTNADSTVVGISIHVPREGDDLEAVYGIHIGDDISIHVPREGDDEQGGRQAMEWQISIHVPREGDDEGVRVQDAPADISIHVPREGDDPA